MDSGLNQRENHLDNEISIVPFKFKYLPLLLDMLKDRDFLAISTITMKNLPKIGYIALMNKQPIAAGFLRRVEGGYAQMDTLCSNPYYGSIIRHEGIDGVVKALIEDAKLLKLQGIIAFTEDTGVLSRAQSMDFNVLHHKLIALKLT